MNSTENIDWKNNSSAEKTNGRQSLEIKIKKLRVQLEISCKEFKKCSTDLEWSRNLFDENLQEKEFCVGHLRKLLLSAKEESSNVYKNLLASRTQFKVAKLARKEISVVEKDDLMTKSSVQKCELEDKFSFPSDQWLKQNNHQTCLDKTKSSETFAVKTALQSRWITQDEEAAHLEELLKYQNFLSRNCKDLKQSWTMAIQSKVPEFTEKKKRLKNVCRYYGLVLSKAQDQNKILKQRQKSFGLENEMLSMTHKKIKGRESYLKKRLELLENQRKVLSLHESRKTKDSVLENCFPSYISDFSHQHFVDNSIIPGRTASTTNTWTKIECETVNNWIFQLFMDISEGDQSPFFKLKDSYDDVKYILKHQAEYSKSIKRKFDEQTTKNGCVMSFICTVGKILQNRCRKINSDKNLNSEVFNQIKMLLNSFK